MFVRLRNGRTGKSRLSAETQSVFSSCIPPVRFRAVNEAGEGSITAFSVDKKSGILTQLNQQSTHGGAPCHLAIDKNGRYVITANSTGGNLCVLPIKEDGHLGEAVHVEQHNGSSIDTRRQTKPMPILSIFPPTTPLPFPVTSG